ncbi:type I secretion system permease/ATPase [Microbulbifer yueqingensis]|uniref:ATP-binding cassette, subfamily C, LapB n=1 Tax=Microbulbifer yueqingensis TaxID=658219 RepID=A0A1G9E5V4_9GAMM|nr:type I secretion system permease/ATPase [Microbulbifer yueqingensis]SDK71502.1 ATP-binding cassette, subfamily C, LapB [Microbulbifer yueqingensis]
MKVEHEAVQGPALSDSRKHEVDYTPWLEAIVAVSRHYRLDFSEENIRIAADWGGQESTELVLRQMARQAGLTIKFTRFDQMDLTPWRLPVVVQLDDGQVGVIETIGKNGKLGILWSGDQGLETCIDKAKLAARVHRLVVLRPRKTLSDVRVDDYIKPDNRHWFRKIILRDLKPYGHVMLATTVANTLALSGILFAKQVYDRVIPAESMATLYVLFSGVLLAVVFDFVMRLMRVRITDLLGKRADIRVSDLVFGHAVRLRNSAKPKSTGTFISQLRELERVRDMVTSTTVLAIADMPFFFLFLLVLWVIAGPLVLIPLLAIVLLIIPGLLAQKKLARLSGEAMRESSLRNAMLVETVQGMEDIKTLQAEHRFQRQWNHFNAVTAESNLKLRYLTSKLVTWTHNVQSSVFALTVLFGAPMVMSGDMTTGALVAASILSSRMMSPMANITQVLSRWQMAKFALDGIDNIMQLPVDQPEGSKRVHKAFVRGEYEFQEAEFKYSGEPREPALYLKELRIVPGEKIAVLGKNGAGKSTLLQALSGMLEAASGTANLDGVAITHIDPADIRRDVGLLSQNSGLFHGTLRENLTLGAPNATDDEIFWALEMTGALEMVRNMPKGMDHMVLEGGSGLSGGQKQSLLLSRLLLRQPSILLLDEPTASLDEATERRFINNLLTWSGKRTVVLATHRSSTLKLVDRILVVDRGRIVMDGSKDEVMARLSGPERNVEKDREQVT